MKYKESIKRPREFLALTGHTVTEFAELVPYFREAFETWMETHTMTGHPREGRSYSNYKNSPLPTSEDKLFFILTYLKQAPTQTAHGSSFGMVQSKANQWIHALHEALNLALAQAGAKPARRADALSEQVAEAPSEVPASGESSALADHEAEAAKQAPETSLSEKQVPVRVFFHDGTERPIQRPSDPVTQKAYYSGKKNNIR